MNGAVLLFDTGPDAGMGHQRRMQALAGALRRRSIEVRLAPTDSEIDPTDLVMIDSYRWRAEHWRTRARVLAAVDDLYRDLDVDLLVDPSPGAVPSRHRLARTVLAGAQFALIDVRPPPGQPAPLCPSASVLVACGAADRLGIAQRVAGALARMTSSAEIRVVIGPWSDQRLPPGVHPVRTVEGLEAELLRATVVVTAGGVTLLEALALGRPTVALALEGNQRQAVLGAAQADAALFAGSIEEALALVTSLLIDGKRRDALSEAARNLVDGLGSERVASAALDLISVGR